MSFSPVPRAGSVATLLAVILIFIGWLGLFSLILFRSNP
jgi:hypothetical protein